MKRAIVLFIALTASGCGGAMHEPGTTPTDEPEQDLAGYEARIDALRRKLSEVAPMDVEGEVLSNEQGASDAERCAVAADLRDRICDLGQRICDIAQRDPGAADTALKCQRSADACSDARYRVGQACGAGR